MSEINTLISNEPYSLPQKEKEILFKSALITSIKFHYTKCPEFKLLCDSNNFDPDKYFSIEDVPYIPINLFKRLKLLSVPESEIVKKVISSSTTGNIPSSIYLDNTTTKRQIKCLNSIMNSFLGNKRKTFVIFDNEKTITLSGISLSSRGSAIRGMLPFAKKMHFILNNDLKLDYQKLQSILDELRGEEIYFFGFTWLIYKILTENPSLKISNTSQLLHIGGWKKIKDIGVNKEEFNNLVKASLNAIAVRDIYGMTEQLGTVYIDCENGYKHVPAYSEILMRDPKNLTSTNEGLIQLLSPIPNSYPGISILSDDIGIIIGEDNCSCGRKGKYFLFKERAKKAEIKGCGDTL